MSDPFVLDCAAQTAEAKRKGAEMDDRLAAGQSEFMKLMATSRAAVARSRRTLRTLKARDGK